MRICVIGGMIDAKLVAKLAPLQNLSEVEIIDLIRRNEFQGPKVKCHSPPKTLLKWLPLAEAWRIMALIWVVLRHKPELLVAFGTVPHGVYAWLVGRLFRISVIQHVMGKNDLRLTFPGQKGKGITLAAVRAGNMIAVRGHRMKQWLETMGVPPEKVFIQHNIHDFTLFTPRPGQAKDYELIYVGLLAPYKRIDLMLEMLQVLKKKGKKPRLLLVGDGPQKKALEETARQLEIDRQVEFAGNKKFSDLPPLYQRAKVFIMTSQGEGLPQAMIEAMSCGLPTIVPADADIEEVARHGVNALVVNPPTAEAFAQATERLLSEKSLFKQLHEGALQTREEYRNKYSLTYQTKSWAKVIRCLTSDNLP